jgi:EF hand
MIKKLDKRTGLALSLGALAVASIAGIAYAQQRPHMKMDADSNGSVSRAEAQAFSGQMFTRIDVNKDGKLDAADRTARREARFTALDADKNGQISRAEFDAARPMAPGMAAGGRSDGDRRGRGHRGHGGMGGGMGHGGGRGGMMGMAAMADTNKDQAISRAEFDAATNARFAATDTDKNGQISAAEHQAARAAMRAEWRNRMQSSPAPAASARPEN